MKYIANANCEIKVTVVGGPTMPGFIPGSAVVSTPPSSDVKVGGAFAYSGELTVQVPLVFAPPAFVAINPPTMTAVCTIKPTGKHKINGKQVIVEGDKSDAVVWAGTAGATSPSPTPCGGTLVAEIASAGQATVLSTVTADDEPQETEETGG